MFPGFSSILTAAAALAAVLGFILLAARFVRPGLLARQGLLARPGLLARQGLLAGLGNGPLAVRDVLALDAGRRLHLVRCEGRDFLLLTGGAQDVFVGWLPEREPAA